MTTLCICTNWKNSAVDTKKTAFEIYETNGIFPTACHHGLIEILCEIVEAVSCELYIITLQYCYLLVILSAKYPLAMTNFVLDTYGKDQVLGFNIGCSFDKLASYLLKRLPILVFKLLSMCFMAGCTTDFANLNTILFTDVG